MPTITLDGTGPTKASLVEGAYSFCGLNAFEYDRTPEEMIAGLVALNDLAAALLTEGIDLGFDFPTYGSGLLEEPSGIPTGAARPIKALLAQTLAPGLGATLTDDARAVLTTAMSKLYAINAAAPVARIPAQRMLSSGVRHGRLGFTSAPVTGDPGDLAGLIGG